MITTANIDEAIRAAVAGGSFMSARLAQENPDVVFAAGLASFINVLLQHDPRARLSEVKAAIVAYARQRQRPM